MLMKNKLYLLDTNILIDFLDGEPSVIEHVLQAGVDRCYMSAVSLHELYYGAYLARERKEEYFEKEIKKIHKLLEHFDVLYLSENGEHYGNIKYALKKNGEMIDEFDILIAGQAMSEDLIVVTDNLKHFNRIKDLKIENWMMR
jgi:tRNA(fMet)-specific endonuclease VapC